MWNKAAWLVVVEADMDMEAMIKRVEGNLKGGSDSAVAYQDHEVTVMLLGKEER